MFAKKRGFRGKGRRGVAVVLVAVTGTLMVGFSALTIDLGTLYIARGELQRTADAAALAGASIYFTNAGLTRNCLDLTAGAFQRSSMVSGKNPVHAEPLALAAADVSLGQHDYSHPDTALRSTIPWNAVQVKASRTSDSATGPCP